ncbi:MAG: hypothetical protein B6226_02320 [Candidatus Cloacimonetes bacterium 4572_65]|nr:MAG: hypothetical protein B6226_02320 [Candidatus Cloacimonetes bacterium 4572_65]
MFIDVMLVIFIILMVIWGFYKGLISGLMSFVTGVAIYISLTKLTLPLSSMMIERWGMSNTWALILSIVGQVLAISITTTIIVKVIEFVLKSLNLNLFNRILGSIFGLLSMQFVITLFMVFVSISGNVFLTSHSESSRICAISDKVNSTYIKKVVGVDLKVFFKEYLENNKGL